MTGEEIKFPEWRGYSSIKDKDIENVGNLFTDRDSIIKAFMEQNMRANYFEDMLRYIQYRLEKHLDGEPLGLCINSASEIFEGIMISPCDSRVNEVLEQGFQQYPNSVLTTEKYWDCECEKNYIHPKTQNRCHIDRCHICGAIAEEQPDSRVNEVLKQGFPL